MMMMMTRNINATSGNEQIELRIQCRRGPSPKIAIRLWHYVKVYLPVCFVRKSTKIIRAIMRRTILYQVESSNVVLCYPVKLLLSFQTKQNKAFGCNAY